MLAAIAINSGNALPDSRHRGPAGLAIHCSNARRRTCYTSGACSGPISRTLPRPFGARCAPTEGAIPAPNSRCDDVSTGWDCATALTNVRLRRCGEPRIWSFRDGDSSSSWTAASGTRAQSTDPSPRRDASGGLRSWNGLSSGIGKRTRHYGTLDGPCYGSGNTRIRTRPLLESRPRWRESALHARPTRQQSTRPPEWILRGRLSHPFETIPGYSAFPRYCRL